MANRSNTFLLKRSNVLNKIPTLSGLTLGELGLNTADSKLYTLYTGGLTGATEVRQIGWDRLSISGGTVTGDVLINGSISATTFYGSGQYLTNLPSSVDNYVTGGTYSNGTLTLNRQNGSITITGFTTGSTSSSVNTFVTGFTYSNNNVTLSQNQGQSPLSVNISTMTGLTVNGNLTVTGSTSLKSFNATSGVISGTGQSILTIVGSGSSTSAPLFTIQGSSGELVSVTDSLTGSLFSVNDISGLPILEVFSDNTTLMGSYLAPSLNTTKRVSLTAGTNSIYSIPTSAYTGAFFDYTVLGSTGARAGNIMSIFSGVTVQYTEVTTNNIGSTAGVTFSMAVSNNLVTLSSSATTTGWTLKTIIRGI